MRAKPRRIVTVLAGLLLAGTAAGVLGDEHSPESIGAQTMRQAAPVCPVRFAPLNAELPVSSVAFPPGKGSEIANAYCLMCHSAGMVLRQPALIVDEWNAEIRRMQSAFGAPIPPDQVDALARYLGGINGRQSDAKPSTVDNRGS
jgi:mono/diheme cytochrome c family protein